MTKKKEGLQLKLNVLAINAIQPFIVLDSRLLATIVLFALVYQKNQSPCSRNQVNVEKKE